MATSGPFYRNVNVPGVGITDRMWYRQKPITQSPLPFQLAKRLRVSSSGYPDTVSYGNWATTTLDEPAILPLKDLIYLKAYRRLQAQVSEAQAQLGATFGERKQAYTAVIRHVRTLTKAAAALKRGNIDEFRRTLKVKLRMSKLKSSELKAIEAKKLATRLPTVREVASTMAGVWLEYSYGWKPLVGDIYSAIDVLQKPIPYIVARGKAQGKFATATATTWSTGRTDTSYAWHLRLLLQMKVSVSNWYAWKANELGLTNPLSIAWELVPFSFVVDWFLPIGNYLQSLTDFVGLDLEDSFRTWYGIHDRVDSLQYYPDYYWVYNYMRHDRRVDVVRLLSLPSVPKLQSRFTGFYSARGANAIALLTSTLKDLPNVPAPRRFKMSRSMYNWERNLY